MELVFLHVSPFPVPLIIPPVFHTDVSLFYPEHGDMFTAMGTSGLTGSLFFLMIPH
jgi:hypothetical protein